MLRVIETFSGIGSQAKALKKAGIPHEIVAASDWDVGAIIAYDLIHYGPPEGRALTEMSVDEVDAELDRHTFSMTGKAPSAHETIRRMPEPARRRLLAAMERSHNLVSITDIKGENIPDDIDLLTYSFPCQDLSLCKFWHGDVHGISRDAHTRSGMLWEVERILREMQDCGRKPPRFLLMENVVAILNQLNRKDFGEWKSILTEMGYENFIFRLNAKDFGIPQNRERAYMISVRCDGNPDRILTANNFFRVEYNLEIPDIACELRCRDLHLPDILKVDYTNPVYREEAEESQPNDTVSREQIYKENEHLLDAAGRVRDIIVKTLTTKQDRHPNSGVIDYSGRAGGARYRNLTPRECFLLMGFDEEDYDMLRQYNLTKDNKTMLFSRDKNNRLAGNSIVVDVLVAIFRAIVMLRERLWPEAETDA